MLVQPFIFPESSKKFRSEIAGWRVEINDNPFSKVSSLISIVELVIFVFSAIALRKCWHTASNCLAVQVSSDAYFAFQCTHTIHFLFLNYKVTRDPKKRISVVNCWQRCVNTHIHLNTLVYLYTLTTISLSSNPSILPSNYSDAISDTYNAFLDFSLSITRSSTKPSTYTPNKASPPPTLPIPCSSSHTPYSPVYAGSVETTMALRLSPNWWPATSSFVDILSLPSLTKHVLFMVSLLSRWRWCLYFSPVYHHPGFPSNAPFS